MKCKKSDILSECEYSKDNCFGYKRGELMDYKHLIRFFLQKLKTDNIGAYAAQAALFIIMSAIPFLLVFLSLLRFTPVSESTVLSVIQMVLPGQIKITPMLINVVNEVYTNSAKMLPIAVIFAVYSAAKSIQSLRYGLNIVYDTDETRNWFVLRFRAMIETLILVLVIIKYCRTGLQRLKASLLERWDVLPHGMYFPLDCLYMLIILTDFPYMAV